MALDANELTRRLENELLSTKGSYWVHIQTSSPIDKYPAKQHAVCVGSQLAVPSGLIYLAGQRTTLFEDSDQPRPFRQRRYFYYVTGVNVPDCFATYDIARDFLTLYIPPINPRTVVWNGRGPSIDECKDRQVGETDPSLDEDIESYVNGNANSKIYALHPDQRPYLSPRRLLPAEAIRDIIDTKHLQTAMDNARVRKCPHEVDMIRRANAITASAHRSVLQGLRNFDNEAQIQALFLDSCVAKDAKNQAYEVIAASGENASTLHYVDNNQPLKGRQLVCLDAGCEWDCYASDVTRTFPISGHWSKEAKQIHDLVEEMQNACIKAIKPGVRFRDLHFLAHRIAVKGLLKLGILHGGTGDEIYKAGTSGAFFPHGIGHHLGLEVHDVSGNEPLMSAGYSDAWNVPTGSNGGAATSTKLLEEGMVVTVEPGIYFSKYSLSHIYLPSPVHSKYINQDVLQRYYAVGGVRIEDDILVTADGYENLTTAPKGEEMLRIIRGEDTRETKAEDPVTFSRGGTGGRIERINAELRMN